MWNSVADLLHLLEAELQFLDRGRYRDPDCWRPQFIFLDSPTCVNPSGSGRPDGCKNCLLMPFVPVAMRQASVPCHHIPLTKDGRTVDGLQRWGTQEELEDTVRSWLARNILLLQRALAVRLEAKQPNAASNIASRSDEDLEIAVPGHGIVVKVSAAPVQD